MPLFRNPFLLALISVAFVGGGAYFVFRVKDSGGEQKTAATVPETVRRTIPIPVGGAESLALTSDSPGRESAQVVSRPPDSRVVSEVERAVRGREALAIIERAMAEGVESAFDARLNLDGVCVAAPYVTHPEAVKMLGDYCEGVVFLADGERPPIEGRAMKAQLDVERALELALSQGGVPALEERLSEFMKNGDAASASHGLHFAAEQSVDLPLLAADGREFPGSSRLATAAGRREVMSLAAEIAYCRTSGGCGPGSLSALRACVASSLCDARAGLLDVLRRTSSPEAFSAADALVQRYLGSGP